MEISYLREQQTDLMTIPLRTLHLQKYSFNAQKKARLRPYNKVGILALSTASEVTN